MIQAAARADAPRGRGESHMKPAAVLLIVFALSGTSFAAAPAAPARAAKCVKIERLDQDSLPLR